MRSGKYLRLNANYHTNLCKIFFAQASAYSTFSSPNPSLHFSGFVIVEDNNLNIHKKVVGDDSKSSPGISVQFFSERIQNLNLNCCFPTFKLKWFESTVRNITFLMS